jgi:hypothetical protein
MIEIDTTNLTFENLPTAVGLLIEEIKALRSELLEQKTPPKDEDTWFSIDQLREYLPDHPAKATIYGWVSTRQIPHHKGNKKLRFRQSDIDNWLSGGKRKSEGELNDEAKAHQKGKRRINRYE